jgi:hypothetical protein
MVLLNSLKSLDICCWRTLAKEETGKYKNPRARQPEGFVFDGNKPLLSQCVHKAFGITVAGYDADRHNCFDAL